MESIQHLVRGNIMSLQPYSSARDEFSGPAEIYLDANENPFPSNYNRYPDPLQRKLKEKLAILKKVNPNQIFLGNGSDEAIDLLIRVFCEPHRDSILVTEPTYGMYAVCAGVNSVKVESLTLTEEFQLDINALQRILSPNTKIIFLCSPNNPTGNLLNKETIKTITEQFSGIVVVDEAYIDFARDEGFIPLLNQYPNLVILQTFSKAWGLAGLRLGVGYASVEIIELLNKIKYPYNVNTLTQQVAWEALENIAIKEKWVNEILNERTRLSSALQTLPFVLKVYPSDANFLLVKMNHAKEVYSTLLAHGIIVRNRTVHANGCLRITIGTPAENDQLLKSLKNL
jgi:histidinol-phosphate aminotransferase